MEYFVDATINFKGTRDLEAVEKKIKEQFGLDYTNIESCYCFEEKDNNILAVVLDKEFEFCYVEPFVKAILDAGLKKFGRDKLIAYQTTADCYFKNYVTKDGKFLDYCGDCIY